MKGNKGERRKICVESIVYDDSKMEACLAMVGRRIHAERTVSYTHLTLPTICSV